MNSRCISLWLSGMALALICVSSNAAQTRAELSGRMLELRQIGLAQELRSDYYLGAFFVAPNVGDIRDANASVPMRMSFVVLANRLSAREFQRHWKERIALNNPRAEWQKNGSSIVRFAEAMKDTLQRGDRVDFDRVDGLVRVSLNDQMITEFQDNGFYSLLLNCWLGDNPPTQAFRRAMNGNVDVAQQQQWIKEWQLMVPVERELASLARPSTKELPVLAAKSAQEAKSLSVKPQSKSIASAKPNSAKPTPNVDTIVVAATKAAAIDVSVATQPDASVESSSALVNRATQELVTANVDAPEVIDTDAQEIDKDLLLGEYKRQIIAHIQRHLEYPSRAWRLGLTGDGSVRVTIGENGAVNAKEVVESTGQMLLDRSMLDMVERAMPLPPAEIPLGEFQLDIPVSFTR